MEWVINNPQAFIGLAVLVFGLIATWTLFGADIKQLKKDFSEMKAESKKDSSEIKTELHELVKVMQVHNSDTTLHIDPRRDEKRWDDLKTEIFRRFDGMEEKIEKLMIIHPPGPLI